MHLFECDGVQASEDLFTEVGEVDVRRSDFPALGVGYTFPAKRACDDLVAETNACARKKTSRLVY